MIQYGRWKKYVSYSILMMLEVGVNIIETLRRNMELEPKILG